MLQALVDSVRTKQYLIVQRYKTSLLGMEKAFKNDKRSRGDSKSANSQK